MADFANAEIGNEGALGEVVLVRDPEQAIVWRKIVDKIKSSIDRPPLFVRGKGRTFTEALIDANSIADGLAELKTIEKMFDEVYDDIKEGFQPRRYSLKYSGNTVPSCKTCAHADTYDSWYPCSHCSVIRGKDGADYE
jgi:hypothetical protein